MARTSLYVNINKIFTPRLFVIINLGRYPGSISTYSYSFPSFIKTVVINNFIHFTVAGAAKAFTFFPINFLRKPKLIYLIFILYLSLIQQLSKVFILLILVLYIICIKNILSKLLRFSYYFL